MNTKLLPIALVLLPIFAATGESFFFEYTQGPKPTEQRIEGGRLETVTPIRKIEAPQASAIFASYTGLGPGREYQIQVDFKTAPAELWLPKAKLGDDIITSRISSSGGEDGSPFSYNIEGSDPEKIKAWTQELGELLRVPEDRIDIDLTKSEADEADGPIPVPVPQAEEKGKPEAGAPAGGITAAEYTDKSQRTIRFKVNGVDKDITAPEGKFWDELIVCKNKKVAYFILKRGNRGGAWPEDLHRFVAEGPDATEKPKKIPLKANLKEVTISQIHDASDDGSRLFVVLHYMTKRVGESTHYDSYPYFLNSADGTVTPVKP